MTKASTSATSTPVTSNEKAAKFRRPAGAPRVSARARQNHAHGDEPPQRGPDPNTVRLLHEALLTWYAGARRDLPWRRTRDPYSVWLSEVMLQQTRVETVIPYYERFLARWPTVRALADAPVDDVLAAWSGLGYYRRARMLHAAAQAMAAERGVPPDAEGLLQIKGIGRYTAGAVASIAYGEAAPLVDGNVARVFARLFALEDDMRGTKGIARVWELAATLVQVSDPGAWNQALMELGATVCVPRDPRCLVCPVREACRARALGTERDLPRMKPKAKPREQRRWALVATRGETVLLGQRRPELRFGGLWEPPSVDALAHDETVESAVARLVALTGANIKHADRAGAITHVLSHRRLEVAVLSAELDGRFRASAPRAEEGEYARFEVVPRSSLAERGVATLARKILDV